MLTRQDALQLLDEHVSSAKKKRHAITVSAIMKELAKKLGKNEQEWELVGLLHDLDYDLLHGDMRKHGLVASEMLEGKISEEGLQAIRSHDYRTGVKPESVLDKMLIASDCIWVLIVRVAFTTSQGKVRKVRSSTLESAFERKSFPSFLKSGILMCRDSGLALEDFLEIAIKAIPSDMIVDENDL